jgi:putative zinc finger/helix-turn-helix YgiT family protein
MERATMTGYCPNCEKVVTLSRIRKQEELTIRGEKIEVTSEFLKCSECGEEFEDPKSHTDPLIAAYAEYRRRKNMVTPEQIFEFRKTYGLSQKELSELVSIGVATLSRYENGSLQEEAHDKLLHFIMESSNFKELVESDDIALTESKKTKIFEILENELENRKSNTDLFLNLYGNYDSDDLSGFRKLDLDRMLNMILFFCGQEGVFKTKLNKLLFYADFKHFKEYTISISGFRYAHALHGFVPDNFKKYYPIISDGEEPIIKIQEEEANDFIGEKFYACKEPDLSIFHNSEILVLSFIKEFFKDYSALKISKFSHQEDAYIETKNGELISYQLAKRLKI